MIEFRKVFDLIGSINNFIARRRQEFGVSESVPVSPRVLTQEKDGSIIYSWTDYDPPNKKAVAPVTHVALFDSATQDHKLLWINSRRIKIVSCSINKPKSLLAFTTLSKVDGKSGKDMYQAFLVEIQASAARVFSLNLERVNFLKVQFLYPSHPEHSSSRESHLLVCLHKESVGLYKIPLGRVGDGTVMSGQPKTEQIVGKFVWCQWDAVNQRLHYIHNFRINSDETGNDKIGQKLSTLQFHQNANFDNMIDFPLNFPFPYIRSSSRSHYADRPLNPGIPDVSLNASVLSQSNGTFCLCYQHQHIASHKNRTSPTVAQEEEDSIYYYICMVHHVKTINGCVSGLPRSLIGSRRLSFHWLGDYLLVLLPGFFVHLLNVGLEFEPVHHILLHNHEWTSASPSASISLPPKDNSSELHLTETSSLDEHTILFNHDTRSGTVRFQLVEDMPISNDQSLSLSSLSSESSFDRLDVMSAICTNSRNIHSLSLCVGFTREIGGTLYDYRNGSVWKLSISMEGLMESFKTAYAQTRQAILHYVILRTKDIYTVRKLFLDICENLTKSELAQSMAEYLVAATYCSMKRQLEKEVLRLLPFTAAETLRGQFERSATGERLARLSYTSLESINMIKFTKKTTQERHTHHRVNDDMWDILRRRLHLQLVDTPSRFLLEAVGKKISKHLAEEQKAKWETIATTSQQEKLEEDFLGSMHIMGQRLTPIRMSDSGRGRGSRSDLILGPLPAFLLEEQGEGSSKTRTVSNMTEELLSVYLSHHLKTENKIKAQNVAKEYIACQVQKCNQLCHLLWSLKRPEPAWTDSENIPDLCEPGNDQENDLFQIYERLYLTMTELCFPIPPGFQTCLTVIGFRCLNFRMFLQYVDCGVLSLTGQFVTQLLADVPDNSRENTEIKYQIISRLPKNLAEACMRRWNLPLCDKYFANLQVSEILLDGVRSTKGKHDLNMMTFSGKNPLDSSTEESASSHVTFAPLASFIRHLEEFTKNTARRTARSHAALNSALDVDKVLLEDVGLQHTRHLPQYDMSTVHF